MMSLQSFRRHLLVLELAVLFCSSGCLMRSAVHPMAAKLNAEAARDLKAGHLQSARASLMVALEYNPCYAGALHNLALVEFMSASLDRAQQLEMQALECRDDLVQAINGIGLISRKRGDSDLAIQWFEHALELDPACLDARRNLIDTLKMSGRIAEARDELLRLGALEKNN